MIQETRFVKAIHLALGISVLLVPVSLQPVLAVELLAKALRVLWVQPRAVAEDIECGRLIGGFSRD
jgi:hypothetical protein